MHINYKRCCFASGRRRAIPAAFTLVELLVVIAVLGILVSLLLPAVNSAREAARRIQCVNNLKQIGLALTNFEGANGHYPVNQSGGGGAGSGDGCREGYFSWHARILPYLEEEVVYDSIDFKVGMADACDDDGNAMIGEDHANAAAAKTVISAFLCPSDGQTGENEVLLGSANPASDNYAGNAGWPPNTTGRFENEWKAPMRFNGLISVAHPAKRADWHLGRGVRTKDIRDGLSKTAIVAERLIQTANSRQEIKASPESMQSLHITRHNRSLDAMAKRCDPDKTHADTFFSAHIGRAWISGWGPTAPTYMHVKGPNTNNCHFGEPDAADGNFIVAPSSNHHHGVNLLFADGAVTFVSDDVDREVWWALGSRDRGDHFDLLDLN